ncbi:MAG: T9SS type A sorting domain-containing protein, partial [Ignavibacteria bacterium]|nr:T9SS type A sorting domain-containing protein [Ignavibacteria bacterium]
VEQVARLKSIDGNLSSEFLGGSRTGSVICFSGGPNTIVGINNISAEVPDKYSLSQNYPNPFNPVTKIKFDIAGGAQNVKLIVYDAIGREVAVLINQSMNAGSYESEFRGENFASGIYFFRLTAGDFNEIKKMTLLK